MPGINSFWSYRKLRIRTGTPQSGFWARLNINTFKSTQGGGVEFLEYITPRNGRPYPLESYPWDLWHYQTEMIVRDRKELSLILKRCRPNSVAIDVESISQILIRDPDRHAILLKLKE